MALMDLVVMKSRKTIVECKKKLETEEASKQIAILQGTLAGAKLFLSVVHNNYTSRTFVLEAEIDEEGKEFELRSFDNKSIADLELSRRNLESDPEWEKVAGIFERAIREKQIWLFYTAEKGRDLDYCHGWRDGLQEYVHVLGDISSEYQTRVRQNPLFAEEFALEEK